MNEKKKHRSPQVISEENIVLEHLKQLNQMERNILGLYYYENLTVGTIAQLMEMPETDIESCLSTVIQTIRQEIRGEQPADAQTKQKDQTQIWSSAPLTGALF